MGKKKKKDSVRKGKKAPRKRTKISKGKLYEVQGDKAKKKNRICPKCGSGVFLAEHNNRFSCGNCSYTEMKAQ